VSAAVVACVGTTHPYGTSGLLVELAAVRALGGRPLAVVAGVSAQDAAQVLARAPLEPATIAAQFEALSTAPVGAFSVGALLGPSAVAAVAECLAMRPGIPVICDPVIAATGGDRLADDLTVAALRLRLFPHCTLLTPNLDEAALLLGRPIASRAAMRAAIPALLALGPKAVLLKGGHLEGAEVVDVFGDGERIVELAESRIDATLRGTGSLLSAAIATRCAFGDPLLRAIEAARAFVRVRIQNGVAFAGMRVGF
jgi:hydroxymethylpyrimidine/phosphomethylpyrimidine kinase